MVFLKYSEEHRMKKKTLSGGALVVMFLILFLSRCIAVTSIGGNSNAGEQFPVIHSIYDLNKEAESLDSHAGEEVSSVLEMDLTTFVTVPRDVLGISNPVYSRIKKTKNGNYLLFYQGAQIGSNIYYSRSSDLKTWTQGKLLFEKRDITTSYGNDERRFSTADAVVLSTGDVLAVASFRANHGYSKYPEYDGLMMRRSKDNGFTWGEEQVIYTGTNWEPYLLELPSGRVECYFTDSDHTIGEGNKSIASSGVAMVVSDDSGITWYPQGTSVAYRVIRQFKYENAGYRVYTDQMPSVRMLNDGVSLAAIVESRLETGNIPGGTPYYRLSLAYGKNDWTPLDGDSVGPQDRQSNVCIGAGPYLAQFPSGETVISCNINSLFSMKIGDSQARNFNHSSWDTDWYQPFSGTGYWGSLELDGPHEIIGTMHSGSGGIQLARFILNHRINAPRMNVVVDGDTGEWTHTDALFIGSHSAVQTVFRAARDGENLYLLVERRDSSLALEDTIDLYLHNDDEAVLNGHSLKISIGPGGIIGCASWSGDGWKVVDIPGLNASGVLMGKVDDFRADIGYLMEIAVPLAAINAKGSYFRFNAVTFDGGVEDTFSFAKAVHPHTWMLIKQ
jgi:hypothetical protein